MSSSIVTVTLLPMIGRHLQSGASWVVESSRRRLSAEALPRYTLRSPPRYMDEVCLSELDQRKIDNFCTKLSKASLAQEASVVHNLAGNLLFRLRDDCDEGICVEPIARPQVAGAISSVYIRLVELRCANLYADPIQTMISDSALILTKIFSEPRMAAAAAPPEEFRPTSNALHTMIIAHPESFHADTRTVCTNLALTLRNFGVSFTTAQLDEFASRSEVLLLQAGQYSLQNHLIWLLKAYELSHSGAAAALHVRALHRAQHNRKRPPPTPMRTRAPASRLLDRSPPPSPASRPLPAAPRDPLQPPRSRGALLSRCRCRAACLAAQGRALPHPRLAFAVLARLVLLGAARLGDSSLGSGGSAGGAIGNISLGENPGRRQP